MILTLLALLFILLVFIGRGRGVKTFITLFFNYIILVLAIISIIIGVPPIIASLIACILISLLTLFFLNEINKKTVAAFISIVIVLVIVCFLILFISKADIAGFTVEEVEEIGIYSYSISINMIEVMVAVILIGLVGSIIDTSIAISSALNEVHVNNLKLKKRELFNSGLSIGKDILGTTTNTLFFAFLSGFIGYFIWYSRLELIYLINLKGFVAEFSQIMISIIGCVMIIPVSSFITTLLLKKD